jgi:hypothetical protein
MAFMALVHAAAAVALSDNMASQLGQIREMRGPTWTCAMPNIPDVMQWTAKSRHKNIE